MITLSFAEYQPSCDNSGMDKPRIINAFHDQGLLELNGNDVWLDNIVNAASVNGGNYKFVLQCVYGTMAALQEFFPLPVR